MKIILWNTEIDLLELQEKLHNPFTFGRDISVIDFQNISKIIDALINSANNNTLPYEIVKE